MDFSDVMLAVEGYSEQLERAEQLNWERTRWMAAVLLSPHTKSGKGMAPRDLIRFPWDTLQPKATKSDHMKGVDQLMKWAKPKKST